MYLICQSHWQNTPGGWSAKTVLEEAALASNLKLPFFLFISSLDFRNRIAHVVCMPRKVNLLRNWVLFLVSIDGNGEWECYIYAQNRTIPFFVTDLLGMSQSVFFFVCVLHLECLGCENTHTPIIATSLYTHYSCVVCTLLVVYSHNLLQMGSGSRKEGTGMLLMLCCFSELQHLNSSFKRIADFTGQAP